MFHLFFSLCRAEGRPTDYVPFETDQENEEINDMFDDSKLGPPFGIVLNGHSLVSGCHKLSSVSVTTRRIKGHTLMYMLIISLTVTYRGMH